MTSESEEMDASVRIWRVERVWMEERAREALAAEGRSASEGSVIVVRLYETPCSEPGVSAHVRRTNGRLKLVSPWSSLHCIPLRQRVLEGFFGWESSKTHREETKGYCSNELCDANRTHHPG